MQLQLVFICLRFVHVYLYEKTTVTINRNSDCLKEQRIEFMLKIHWDIL